MWEAHLGHGFFGFTAGEPGRCGPRSLPEDASPEEIARHRALSEAWRAIGDDIGTAFEACADVRGAFFKWLAWTDAPPFAGGVLTDWPARLADGLAFAKREWAAVQAHVRHEAKKEAKRG